MHCENLTVQQISVPFEHSLFRDCSVSISGSFRASRKQYGLEHAEVQNWFRHFVWIDHLQSKIAAYSYLRLSITC